MLVRRQCDNSWAASEPVFVGAIDDCSYLYVADLNTFAPVAHSFVFSLQLLLQNPPSVPHQRCRLRLDRDLGLHLLVRLPPPLLSPFSPSDT